MANNKLEMVGQFISGTTDYPVTIPDFVPNMTIVIYIKVTAVTDTYSQTTAVLASSADYSFLLQADGTYNIQFESGVTSQYVAFVVRQPYTKPVSSWNDLASNANINYIALNEENEQIYEDFYTQFDFQTDRIMVLETAYKWEEMKVFPYLDEEFVFLKRGGRIIGIHRTELIKEQLDEILSILAIMRDIQTDVTTMYNHIKDMETNMQNMYNQVSTWYVGTQEFYNQCLALKNQCQNLYDLMVTTGDNYITQITNLSTTALTNITNSLNSALTVLSNAETESLDDIEAAKIQAIKDIKDAAAEIIGGDFLIKGGTTYTSAKAMEDDIRELQSREGGDIIRVKFFIGLADAGGGTMQRYIKVNDLDGVEITSFDKQKIYNGIIDTTETTGNIYGQVSIYDNGIVYPTLRPGKYNGNFTQVSMNFNDFPQFSLQELYWEQEMNGGTGSWAFNNSYLLAVTYAPGLFSQDTFGDIKNSLGFVNMNMGAYTDAQIIANLNTVFLSGKNSQINMFMYKAGMNPTFSCDTNGYMTFEPVGTTMILKFYPRDISSYYVSSAECRVPMVYNSTINKYAMDTTFELRNIGQWRFYGQKQRIFGGNVSGIMNANTQLKNFSNSNFSISNYPIICMRGIRIEGAITTTRTNATPATGTFPYTVELPTNSSGNETIILTYKTTNGSWETISIAGLIETANTSSAISFTFYLRNRAGTMDTGDVTVYVNRIDAIYY